MVWWMEEPIRMIQTNLRETDAAMDTERLMDDLDTLAANVLMVNAGGIFAFYPSQLEEQYVTPFLQNDLLGELTEKLHRRGKRIIARFDFSKAHESLFRRNPEWFYRNREGREVNYHGIVHTCVNGHYQQRVSLNMIAEVLERYPVDGIFFNMFGYQHWDYSGNHYGPCYCGSCRKRFGEMYGLDLMEYDGAGGPLHREYSEFCERTTRDMLSKIRGHVKKDYPNVAISTYHTEGVDLVRSESNTSHARPLPKWLYAASENIASVEGGWPDKKASCCSINAVDLQYRFTGVSVHETEIRLYEALAAGSTLDFCIIGTFPDYPDHSNLPAVREVYRFQQKNESVFKDLTPLSDVLLVKPENGPARGEYLGLFKILKEKHIQFEVVARERLSRRLEDERGARVLLLPGVGSLTAAELDLLERKQRSGLVVAAAGGALADDPQALRGLFGIRGLRRMPDAESAYFEADGEGIGGIPGSRRWIVAPGACWAAEVEPSVRGRLRGIEAAAFGPPERAYGHRRSGEFRAVSIRGNGAGAGVYYGWQPGELYSRYGWRDHKEAFAAMLERELEGGWSLETDAPPSVEAFVHRTRDGAVLLQLINLSGFNGMTYHAPLPIEDLSFSIRLPEADALKDRPQGVSLVTGSEVPVSLGPQGIRIEVDRLERYEAILIGSGNV
ncbi:family 10 glycosylhydrolase [Saccharibacillus sp. CPCC 101409]|uniref:family 10 glycosylhydrolase n=1 Tax=Saccharibacillus sp. CPCC 101409 TaxID=3058041 RepID=UPI002670D144|nr:family 10 glycosylhydrolase [Saccharibacillus sp. CPCC 101409]MDO3408981.1 family 10 glycosylhydrolase [Saccharibacillus sp. CPCC 101409]